MAVVEPTVGDVMLRRPKTLPADVSVADARAALERASVKMLLLVDGHRFYGAVTSIPDEAEPQQPAIEYVDDTAPTVSETTPIAVALSRLDHKPNGRLVVLDGDELVGLVCLARDGVSFCGSPLA